VDLGSLAANLAPIGIAIGAVLLARAVIVYGFGQLVLSALPGLPRPTLHVLFWAGLRGAVSLAVVLSLPIDLPARPLLLSLTFGVVLFTLLVQGLTMEPLLRRLALAKDQRRQRAPHQRHAQLLMLRAAGHELQRLADDTMISPQVYTQLQSAYHAAEQQLEAAIDRVYPEEPRSEAWDLRDVHAHLLRVEQAALHELQQQGLVDNQTAMELAETIDAQLLASQSDGDIAEAQEPIKEGMSGEERRLGQDREEPLVRDTRIEDSG
jgi:CPA1 family monovalent cation:H+ antiporter